MTNINNGSPAEIKQDHPSSRAGDFYFPTFEVPSSQVEEYYPNIEEPNSHASGQVYTDGAVMSDGHSYAVVRGQPNRPRADLSLAMTSAWLTSPRGHNRHTVEHFMRLGIPITLIGAEGSYHPKVELSKDAVARLSKISLATSAHNFHEILTAADDEVPAMTGHSDIVLLGESRGAMVGMGIVAFADYHKRNVVYSDLTAPCFPTKFSLSEAPEMSKQLLSEPLQLVKIVGGLTLRTLIHYPPTIDPHPTASANNLATLPTLLSGQAGQLGSHIPKLHNMHVTLFSNDIVSNPEGWRQIFAGHPNIRVIGIDGAHLTIAHPSTLSHIESRIFSLIDEVNKQGTTNPMELDFSDIHLSDGVPPLED